MNFDEIDAWFADTHAQIVLLEVYGGEHGISKVALRARLPCGDKFDIITGTDLTKPGEEEKLLCYIKKHKPLEIGRAHV